MPFEIPPKKSLQQDLNKDKSPDSKFEVVRSYAEKFNDKEIIDCMESVLKNSEKIGAGKNANVFDLPGYEELCVKKLFRTPTVMINPIDTEAEIQQDVFEMGIPTPMYYKKLRDNTNGQEYLVMERIDGYSVGDILDGINKGVRPEHQEKLKTLMGNYDYDDFLEKINEMVARLHENNLYHRDLHIGNIMVNMKGEPIIIDWGAAGYESLSGNSDEIYKADGRTWDPSQGKFVWGMMKTRNDDEDLDNLAKTMLKMKKFKETELL
jgi:serine/threonine protein kinase